METVIDSVSTPTAGDQDPVGCFDDNCTAHEIREQEQSGTPLRVNERAGFTALKMPLTPDGNDLPNAEWQKIVKFRNFIECQDWRPGVTKHIQTYACFLRAAHLKVPPQMAMKDAIEKIEDSRGDLRPDEVKRQLMRAYQYIDGHAVAEISGVARRSSPKPVFQPDALAKIASKLGAVDIEEFLKSRSPLPPEQSTSGTFLSKVFKHGEKIIVFTDMMSQGQVAWEVGVTGEHALPVGGDEGVWYLVNPVDGKSHFNPRAGKMSRRSEESVTSFRHLVLESDVADPVLWLKALVQLPLKIAAIYRSGGKSIHALVRVDARSKAEWDTTKNKLKGPLVRIGADLGAMSAVRLSRLPQAWRGERRQELLFLDPDPNDVPICRKAPCRASMAALAHSELEISDAQ